MSAITDRIRAHFDSLGKITIEVPEWDVTIYATPLTVAERQRIYAGSTGDNDFSALARMIIVKAQDADGKPLFTQADTPTFLQKADASVLIRVCTAITRSEAPRAKELGES